MKYRFNKIAEICYSKKNKLSQKDKKFILKQASLFFIETCGLCSWFDLDVDFIVSNIQNDDYRDGHNILDLGSIIYELTLSSDISSVKILEDMLSSLLLEVYDMVLSKGITFNAIKIKMNELVNVLFDEDEDEVIEYEDLIEEEIKNSFNNEVEVYDNKIIKTLADIKKEREKELNDLFKASSSIENDYNFKLDDVMIDHLSFNLISDVIELKSFAIIKEKKDSDKIIKKYNSKVNNTDSIKQTKEEEEIKCEVDIDVFAKGVFISNKK